MSDNNKKDTIYNAEYKALEDLVYYTAIQVAEIVGEPVTTIYSWVKDDCFGDLLNLNKVNGRRVFTKNDIENIKYIKELRSKNYSVQQTREYISKQGFKFGEYDGGLVDPKDPLGFEALAIKLAQKQNEELQEFKKDLITELGKFMYVITEEQKNHLQGVSDELAISLESKVQKIEDLTSDMVGSVKNALDDTSHEIDNNIKESLINQVNEISQVYKRETEITNSKISDIKEQQKEESKITMTTLNEMNMQLQEIKKTTYVTAEEISKQKKTPPNKLWKWFMGWK